MKVIIILLVLIMIIGCSTIPNEYKVEPNESEIMYIESGAIIGSIFTMVLGGTIYWYLDKQPNNF